MIKGHRGATSALSISGLLLLAGLTGVPALCPAPDARAAAPAGALGTTQLFSRRGMGRSPESNPGRPQMEIPEKLRVKQERDLRKYRFDKLKEHAAELAKLAASLHEDLDKSNENILSLQVVDKAAKIEKLAKKIQDEAKLGT
jgi:hypothetical protein